MIATVGFLIILSKLPSVKYNEVVHSKQATFFQMISKYKKYFFLLLGFSLPFAAACSLGTYLINIVTSLGGSTSLYGSIMFVMYITEMSFVALTHSLLKNVVLKYY